MFNKHLKKKKIRPKSVKMARVGYFEIGCKKLQFEKNDFEVYEPDFWDFWKRSILKHFIPRTIPKRCVLRVFWPPNTFLRLILRNEVSLHFWHLFMGITPLGAFIFYSHSKTKKKFPFINSYFGDYVLKWYFSRFLQRT